MSNEFNELKKHVEANIPVSFTEEDKNAIMKKIKNEGKAYQKPRTNHLPKIIAITGIVAAVILISFITMNDTSFQSDMAESNEESATSAENTQMDIIVEEDSDIGPMEDEAIDMETHFNPDTIQVGGFFNDREVLDVSKDNETTIISFEIQEILTGELISYEGNIEFIPNEIAKSQIPIAIEDHQKYVPIYFQDVEALKRNLPTEIEENGEKPLTNVEVPVEKMEYHYTKNGSMIYLVVMK